MPPPLCHHHQSTTSTTKFPPFSSLRLQQSTTHVTHSSAFLVRYENDKLIYMEHKRFQQTATTREYDDEVALTEAPEIHQRTNVSRIAYVLYSIRLASWDNTTASDTIKRLLLLAYGAYGKPFRISRV